MVENAGTGSTSTEAWMGVVAAQQWQQAEDHQRVLQHLAEQLRSMLDQLVAIQAQTSQQVWDHITQAGQTALTGMTTTGAGESQGKPAIRITKMIADDNYKAFLNSFESSAWAAGWSENQ